jgi:hypothetical protein
MKDSVKIGTNCVALTSDSQSVIRGHLPDNYDHLPSTGIGEVIIIVEAPKHIQNQELLIPDMLSNS